MWKDPMYVVLFVVVLLFAVLILIGVRQGRAEEERCRRAGGQIVELRGPNLCVSKDGRIIPL